MIAWQFAQLMFWLNVMHVLSSVVLASVAAILAPPYVAYRLIRDRFA